MMVWTGMLLAEAGGLFDLDATLPLMAIQFLVFVAILNAVFYKPLLRVVDEREEYVRSNQAQAKELQTKAGELTRQYDQELALARREAQKTLNTAQEQAKQSAQAQIRVAQQAAQTQLSQAQTDLLAQQAQALAQLEPQVQSLGEAILAKLLV
ncbi:ATP synthase B chain (subunit II) [Gloeomargarita lithophora Alchichica-D10]|uniref:ATP synthase subunit b' n=1 Tax=Gloeomargarita lithophora Alchichica-D10 TaxID=1188229 RepID=A0A1J0ABD2_9CYAN|nr:F0F1 ATP synthase subunit B' [Gloeomargarita lithophora]APB33239.1 ATP synthase B chain (subunit II) [Gloeomargarita lithophora Alchichica-D10]